MNRARTVLVLFMVTTIHSQIGRAEGQTDPDIFSLIKEKMKNVTAENCLDKSVQELQLPTESVAQVPMYHKLSSHVTYANRSALVHLHNSALYRALYYSFLYQRLVKSRDFKDQPDLVHFYTASGSDVIANEDWFKGSTLMFDKNCFYPNWMYVDFNKTLSLFGVRAWKKEEGPVPETLWVREPKDATNGELKYNRLFVNNSDKNYIHPDYKYCPYTKYDRLFWWPDTSRKSTYGVGVRFSDATGTFRTEEFENLQFFGPSTFYTPVLMTQPYFDCARSNKWIVSMTSPVTDILPRYTVYTYLQRPRFVAIAGMDMEFEKIDVNPCDLSIGNPQPNLFAGTARCKLNTTVCEPLSGFGFRRGGYQCVCRAGLYYPWGQSGPFQGVDIEQATEEQYNSGAFECVTAEVLRNFSQGNTPVSFETKKEFETFDEERWTRAQVVMQNSKMAPTVCDEPVSLSSMDIPGASEQFEAQGRTALRLAHFLSNFLQASESLHVDLYNLNEYEKPPFTHYLKEVHVFGDVIASLISDRKLSGVGVYFDRNKFLTAKNLSKEFFGPFAYRVPPASENDNSNFRAIDLAGYASYPDQDWFVQMKQKWTNDTHVQLLEEFANRGTSVYKGPKYTDGEWSGPTFKCDGKLGDWIISYRVPFFGHRSSDGRLDFAGIVAVDIALALLDINQCPSEDVTNSVFRNTAKCDFESQKCIPVHGRGFTFGAYSCVYRLGYEYPHRNETNKVEGLFMEGEYEKKMKGQPNSYDDIKGKKIQIVTSAAGESMSYVAMFLVLAFPYLMGG